MEKECKNCAVYTNELFDVNGFVEINNLSEYLRLFELIAEDKNTAAEIMSCPNWDRDTLEKFDRMYAVDYIFRGEGALFPKRVAGAFRVNENDFNGLKDASISLYKDFNVAIDEFYRAVAHNLSEIEKGDFIAFAQHHGLDTNFLDVTSSPLVALFMACDNESYRFNGDFCENTNPAYVYLFDDYIDVTDIMNKYPNKSVVELLLEGDGYTIGKMADLMEGYIRRFLNSGKFMPVYMKNICKYIYEETAKEINENAKYYEMTNGKSQNTTEESKAKIKDVCEKAKIAYETDIYTQNGFDPCPFQALRKAIEETRAVKLSTSEPYLTLLIYYLQKINSQNSGDFMPIMVYKPKVSFERARLQQGFFIVQPFKKFVDDRIRLVQEIEHTKAIKINNPELILRQLDYIGINRGALYGDLDNIAKHIKNKNIGKFPRSRAATGLDIAIAEARHYDDES